MTSVNQEKKTTPPKADVVTKECSINTFEGNVVSMVDNKLTMKNLAGKDFSHTVADDAVLTRDGTTCHVEDFKVGNRIRVTTKSDDRSVAIGVECLAENSDFQECCG